MRLKLLIVLCSLVLSYALEGGQAQAQTVYQGETVVTVAVLDPLSGRVITQDRFRHAVQVVVDRRLRGGGQRERNPFNLAINPIGPHTEEGQFSIFSAIPFYDPGDIRDPRDVADPSRIDFLVQYWRFRRNGARIRGQLENSHTREALAVNLLNAVDLNLLPVGLRFATPLAMVEGTTLQGTIDGTQVDLRLSGNTVDSFHPFEARIVATRIQ